MSRLVEGRGRALQLDMPPGRESWLILAEGYTSSRISRAGLGMMAAILALGHLTLSFSQRRLVDIALLRASESADTANIRQLLEQGAAVDARNDHGTTPSDGCHAGGPSGSREDSSIRGRGRSEQGRPRS